MAKALLPRGECASIEFVVCRCSRPQRRYCSGEGFKHLRPSYIDIALSLDTAIFLQSVHSYTVFCCAAPCSHEAYYQGCWLGRAVDLIGMHNWSRAIELSRQIYIGPNGTAQLRLNRDVLTTQGYGIGQGQSGSPAYLQGLWLRPRCKDHPLC